MRNETQELQQTLVWTIGMVVEATSTDKHRIAEAYREAQAAIAQIELDASGSARPRIISCFARFDELKAKEDAACVGWMLTAIEQRVLERDLDDWEVCKAAIDRAVEILREAPVN